MRVLLLSHGAGPYGAETILLALAQGLRDRGHDVVLDFPHPGPALEAARTFSGVTVRVTPRPRLPRNLQEGVRFFLGIPQAVGVLGRLVREVRPQVTWVNSLFNPWAALGARLARSPVIWHLHERVPGFPLGALAAAGMGVTARQIVVISNYVSGTLSSYPWFRERRAFLPNPLLHPLSPLPNEPTGPFTVGFAGQLEPRKRAPDLVRAVARIPDAHAVLVGDGKARGAVEAAIAETGTEDRVRLLGFREDAPAEFHRFHCMAIPSLREPFGLVALEAMARGLPVVACRSGALPEVLGGAALFFPEKDVEAIAHAIERLKENPELRKILRERGLERVREYRKDVWLDGVEALLAKVAEGDSTEGDSIEGDVAEGEGGT